MQRPIGTVGEGDTPLAWFQRLPFVTKYILLGTVLISGACTFGALSLADVAFIPPFITKRFQLWRFITPFFFAGSFSFNFLMHIMALYENCA